MKATEAMTISIAELESVIETLHEAELKLRPTLPEEITRLISAFIHLETMADMMKPVAGQECISCFGRPVDFAALLEAILKLIAGGSLDVPQFQVSHVWESTATDASKVSTTTTVARPTLAEEDSITDPEELRVYLDTADTIKFAELCAAMTETEVPHSTVKGLLDSTRLAKDLLKTVTDILHSISEKWNWPRLSERAKALEAQLPELSSKITAQIQIKKDQTQTQSQTTASSSAAQVAATPTPTSAPIASASTAAAAPVVTNSAPQRTNNSQAQTAAPRTKKRAAVAVQPQEEDPNDSEVLSPINLSPLEQAAEEQQQQLESPLPSPPAQKKRRGK